MKPTKLKKEGLVLVSNKKFKWVKAFYDSEEPSNISYEDALAILDNQEEWENLSLGKKLNVVRVYAQEIAKELDIKVPEIYLAHYNFLHTSISTKAIAHSIKDGISINIKSMRKAVNVLHAVAHELKHIHQFYAMYSDYRPKTLPSQDIIDDWKKESYIASDGSICYIKGVEDILASKEIDANKFSYSYSKRVFGKEKTEVPEGHQLILEKIAIRLLMLEMKVTKSEKRESILNELKDQFPLYRGGIEKLQKRLQKRL